MEFKISLFCGVYSEWIPHLTVRYGIRDAMEVGVFIQVQGHFSRQGQPEIGTHLNNYSLPIYISRL